MAQSKVRVQKATALLREDHQKVKKLFAEYEKLGDGAEKQKASLFQKLNQELTLHATVEEEIFYPAVEGIDKGKTEGDEIVKEAQEEHKIVKTLLAELSEMTPADEAFDAKMKVLMENVEHHAGEEQTDMFPLFDLLEKDEQESVSERLSARKRELGAGE
jgi:hemerythrin superfamily protein